VSSHERLFGSERAGGVVWLGGEFGAPPDGAKIGDCWLPEGDQPCYVLTRAGWVVDQNAAAEMLRSLTSPAGA
jgi:hypothetical protein